MSAFGSRFGAGAGAGAGAAAAAGAGAGERAGEGEPTLRAAWTGAAGAESKSRSKRDASRGFVEEEGGTAAAGVRPAVWTAVVPVALRAEEPLPPRRSRDEEPFDGVPFLRVREGAAGVSSVCGGGSGSVAKEKRGVRALLSETDGCGCRCGCGFGVEGFWFGDGTFAGPAFQLVLAADEALDLAASGGSGSAGGGGSDARWSGTDWSGGM